MSDNIADPRSQISRYINPYNSNDGVQSLAFLPSNYLGGHELNRVQDIIRNNLKRIANTVLVEGQLTAGGLMVVGETVDDRVSVKLEAGQIYIQGAIHDLVAAEFSVPATGSVAIGVRYVRKIVWPQEDHTLRGMAPGTRAEGEYMSPAEIVKVEWGWDGDGKSGQFYPVHPVDEGKGSGIEAPTGDNAWLNWLRIYDDHAHGSYVVEGYRVRALGYVEATASQEFSISEGTLNVRGYKYSRSAASRLVVPEEPDIELIANEPHILAGPAPHTLTLRHGPILTVDSVAVVRERTVTVTRGFVAGGMDSLPDPTASEIVSVTQGVSPPKIFTVPTDCVLSSGAIDWSPSGAEPLPGSTYSVTYRYLATLAADDIEATDKKITLTGGVTDTQTLVTYRYKMPRIDAICVDKDGNILYVKGVSSRTNPKPAHVAANLIRLANVTNVWRAMPNVKQVGTVRLTFEAQRSLEERQTNTEILVAELRLKSEMSEREPAAKRGSFADPLMNDTYRDQGIPQTGSVFDGFLTLPIEATTQTLQVSETSLPFVEEVIASQPWITGSMKINPYQAFSPNPAEATLNPSIDVWSRSETQWTSDTTQRFVERGRIRHFAVVTKETTSEVVGTSRLADETIRARSVDFNLTGFGPGETLMSVTFDGLNVVPA